MAIEVRGASFVYPNGYQAIDNISLTIREGERVAIVGQNGAGKTTAVKLFNGLHRPSSGDVLVDGFNTKEKTPALIARYVGYVFQNPDDQIFNSTVRREIEYMPRYLKMSEKEIKDRVDSAVEITDIGKYLESNPYAIPYPIRKFVAIAAILAARPKYLILDEPTAGQDLHGMETLSNMIRALEKQGVAVVTITHDMEFAVRNFDRVVAMAHRQILLDSSNREVFWNDGVVTEARIKKPVIAQMAEDLEMGGHILFCQELVDRL